MNWYRQEEVSDIRSAGVGKIDLAGRIFKLKINFFNFSQLAWSIFKQKKED